MTEGPDPQALARAMEATWPPAELARAGGFLLRRGAGGGKRVSAATAETDAPDIPAARAAMAAWGQVPLFLIRPGEGALDAALAAQGDEVRDVTTVLAAPAAQLADPPPEPMAAFVHWPPLAMAETLWAEAGIGPGRLAVMHRVAGPRAAVLGRTEDRAAGVAFVAADGPVAVLHALAVVPGFRRRGTGLALLRAAAGWAVAAGADWLALAVTQANRPAQALYHRAGMAEVARYHYRAPPGPGGW
ncbi:MAG: GNAT family N-acetyltransferase [Rhodobacterales bacterium]|nr:GNAT family N-acetyltransferase [Rhodobacterales bacterium]